MVFNNLIMTSIIKIDRYINEKCKKYKNKKCEEALPHPKMI